MPIANSNFWAKRDVVEILHDTWKQQMIWVETIQSKVNQIHGDSRLMNDLGIRNNTSSLRQITLKSTTTMNQLFHEF